MLQSGKEEAEKPDKRKVVLADLWGTCAHCFEQTTPVDRCCSDAGMLIHGSYFSPRELDELADQVESEKPEGTE